MATPEQIQKIKEEGAEVIEALKAEVVMHKLQKQEYLCHICEGTGEGVDEYAGTMIIQGGCPCCKGTGRVLA